MFISNQVRIAMATQPVITVWTILEWGSPVRDLKHRQVQRIFPCARSPLLTAKNDNNLGGGGGGEETNTNQNQ